MAAADGSGVALLRDGRVLAVGGDRAAELYDPGTGRWTATGKMVATRGAFTATLLPDGRVLAVGGYHDGWLASAELYDPGSGSWTATGSLATARGGHTATPEPDGTVLVIGGNNGADGFYATLVSAEIYDPGSQRWTASGSMVTSRAGHTATLLPDGRVLVSGGTTNGIDGPILASAELYDPDSGRWTVTGSMAEGRITHTATLLPNGRVLVAGGRYATRASEGLASAELYDPSSGSWTTTGSMAEPRQNGHAATLLPDGRVLVVGDDHTRSAELYDPSSGRWTAATSALVAPNGTATLLLDGTLLVVSGGLAQLYDPRGWPSPEPVALPIRGSASEVADRSILTAPGPDGGLYVAISAPTGPVTLALLDDAGIPKAGWPVVLADTTSCKFLLPVGDGSVRVVCTVENPGNLYDPMGAFALDAEGAMLAGWPVDLGCCVTDGDLVGDELVLHVSSPTTDVEPVPAGQPVSIQQDLTVAANGSIRRGALVPIFAGAPDGATDDIALDSGFDDGIESGSARGPDGRIFITVGSIERSATRVLVFDADMKAILARSTELPMASVENSPERGVLYPTSPIVALDGTVFVLSDLDERVFALDSSLEVMPGWPYRRTAPLARDPQGFACCRPPDVAAVGPDSTLYLPLQARDATVGGSIVAVGPDGRVRPGWPVELRRAGAEFWSVVVGSDGTVYALAIEPEPGNTSSASILAIAPDSTVRWTTTILDP